MKTEISMACGKTITLVESCGIKETISMEYFMACGKHITLMVGYVLKALSRETNELAFGITLADKQTRT